MSHGRGAGPLPHHREAESHFGWRPLRVLVFYRLLVAGFLLWLTWQGDTFRPLGESDPRLFVATAWGYAMAAFVFLVASRLQGRHFLLQVVGQVVVDIVCISLIMHASGGVGSGVGMLLVVTLAGAGLLLPGRMALLFAALASIAVLAEQLISGLAGQPISYPQAGMLGMTFFATALLAHVLGHRIRENEQLAQQRAVERDRMVRLAGFVMQQSESGYLALDTVGRVVMANSGARELLHLPKQVQGVPVAALAPWVAELYRRWREDPGQDRMTWPESESGPALTLRLQRLGSPGEHEELVLVQIEDSSRAMRHAHQIKLASLGRLTASIAHEIRNPLAAISHASGLLAESPDLAEEDQRLAAIIGKQTRRIDQIIRNVLQLGGRERAMGEPIELVGWLRGFLEEFGAAQGLAMADRLQTEVASQPVWFNPSHLYQVVWNLCLNAQRHSGGCSESPCWWVRLGYSEAGGRPWLEVVDRGPGVAEKERELIFEPFYSTASDGVGLGLYIARQLAEYNRGLLNYYPESGGGSRFRLTFSLPETAERER